MKLHNCSHGVSIPELKKLTNLKMHLKPSVQDVWQNLDSEIEFWQSGRLARGRVSEQQPSEVRAGPPFCVKASRSKIQKWSVTQTASI